MPESMIQLNTGIPRSDSSTHITLALSRRALQQQRQMGLAMVILAIAFMVALPQQVSAQALVGAKAEVNGQTVTVPANAVPGNMTGSAIAAAKIFHPAAMMTGFSYKVNGNNADAMKEQPILDTIANLARPIATNARNPLAQAPFITGTRNRITNCTVEDATGGPNIPCRVVANTGSFPYINKANGILSDTGSVQRTVNNNNYELASATASQMTVNNRLRIIDNPGTQVNAAANLPAPVAVAYTANRDPMAVAWNSPINRTITFDISQLQVNVSTTGAGAAASAFYSISAGIIDGSNDITQPESAATPVFSLLLPFNDVDGMAPTINLAAFNLNAAGSISDNLGDMGLTNVAIGLINDLTLVNGTIEFATPYSLFVGVPGTSSQSVLFLDTQGFAESAANAPSPEPSTLALLGSGLLGFGGLVRKKKNTKLGGA